MMAYAMSMGFAGAAQGPTNAALSKRIGVMQATLVSFTGGFLTLGAVCLVTTLVSGESTIRGVFDCEPWMLLGGVYGAIVVFSIAYSTPRLGVALTVTLQIVGQMVTSFIIDIFGLMNTPVVPVDPLRVAGWLLLLAGIALVYKGRLIQAQKEGAAAAAGNKPLQCVLLMLLSGMVAGIQLPTNVALRAHVSLFEAGTIHFAIGVLVILAMTLIMNKGRLNSLKGVPAWMVTGGLYGAFGITSLIITMPVLGAGLNTAGNQLGQLIGGVIVDTFGFFQTPKSHVNAWRAAGIVVLFAGIVAIALPQL